MLTGVIKQTNFGVVMSLILYSLFLTDNFFKEVRCWETRHIAYYLKVVYQYFSYSLVLAIRPDI